MPIMPNSPTSPIMPIKYMKKYILASSLALTISLFFPS